jgi:predicted transcriptional regulator
MQNMVLFVSMCNTLSRGHYGSRFQNQRTTLYPLYKATMLDDRTTISRTEIFHSIGSPIPHCGGILQQLHSQRKVVYTLLDSQLQSHCRCHTVLVQLHRRKKLQRQKTGRSFIYLAADPRTAARQRRAISVQSAQIQQLPAEIAVLVLVEFIRNPEAGFAQLAKTIKRSRKVTVEIAQIERLFQQHALKKMTLTAGRPLGGH